MTHRPAASSSPQTFLRELSSQADSMRFAALTLGDPSNPRSTPPYSKASTSLDPANAQRQVAMQHDRLTSVPMSPAQTVGMAAAAQWEQSPFPVSVWSSVPEEPQSSAGFVGEYGTPASSRALGLNANDAAFLHGSPPFAPHGTLFHVRICSSSTNFENTQAAGLVEMLRLHSISIFNKHDSASQLTWVPGIGRQIQDLPDLHPGHYLPIDVLAPSRK